MPKVNVPYGQTSLSIDLPEGTDILGMTGARPLADPAQAIREALSHPIGGQPLEEIIRRKRAEKPSARAVIVVSDNTRPVPYRGAQGILAPIVDRLIACGLAAEEITIIIATGTHRVMTKAEIEGILDPAVLAKPVRLICHDCHDRAMLAKLGTTSRGTNVFLNRHYLEAEIKILTGLVESHFMAGTSGGRKSICPGLVGEESTFIFHGVDFLSSPRSADLVLEGNPCHEEATEVARMAGVDFIVNATVDPDLQMTGVFAGDLELAYLEAVKKLIQYVGIPLKETYDVVLTHGAYVGINHYQSCKAALGAMPALKPGARLILAANNTDTDPIGNQTYRTLLHLLKIVGPEAFMNLLRCPDWRFVPDQWETQMWCKLFAKIPPRNFIYCAAQITARDAAILPERVGNALLPPERRYAGTPAAVAEMVAAAIAEAVKELGRTPRVAYLQDGPYGILMAQ